MSLIKKIGERAKEIGEKAKDLGGNISEKAKDLGGNIGEKAMDISKRSGELLEINKIKSEISKLEKEKDNDFKAIGQLYYKKALSLEDTKEEMERLCEAIKKLELDIEHLQNKINELSNKKIKCLKCQQEISIDSKFCPLCGVDLSKIEVSENEKE